MEKTYKRIAGWKGYITDLHDIRDRLSLKPFEAHPVNHALKMVGCVMTAQDEAFIRQVIEAYGLETMHP